MKITIKEFKTLLREELGVEEAEVLWNSASEDIRAQFLRSEMGFMKEDVPFIAACTWEALGPEIGVEARDHMSLGILGAWRDIFAGDPMDRTRR